MNPFLPALLSLHVFFCCSLAFSEEPRWWETVGSIWSDGKTERAFKAKTARLERLLAVYRDSSSERPLAEQHIVDVFKQQGGIGEEFFGPIEGFSEGDRVSREEAVRILATCSRNRDAQAFGLAVVAMTDVINVLGEDSLAGREARRQIMSLRNLSRFAKSIEGNSLVLERSYSHAEKLESAIVLRDISLATPQEVKLALHALAAASMDSKNDNTEASFEQTQRAQAFRGKVREYFLLAAGSYPHGEAVGTILDDILFTSDDIEAVTGAAWLCAKTQANSHLLGVENAAFVRRKGLISIDAYAFAMGSTRAFDELASPSLGLMGLEYLVAGCKMTTRASVIGTCRTQVSELLETKKRLIKEKKTTPLESALIGQISRDFAEWIFQGSSR